MLRAQPIPPANTPPPTDPLSERSPPHAQSAAGPAPTADASLTDWLARDAAEREARQLEGLAELATMAMSLARGVYRRIEAAQDAVDRGGDPKGDSEAIAEADAAIGRLGSVYAQVARTARQAWALENRIAGQRRARMLDQARDAAAARAEVDGRLAAEAAAKTDVVVRAASRRNYMAIYIHSILNDMIDADHDDDDEVLRLLNAAHDYLVEAKEVEDFDELPVGAIVADVCKAIGYTPEWDDWRHEDWAEEDAEARAWGSPFGRGFKAWAGDGAVGETGPPI